MLKKELAQKKQKKKETTVEDIYGVHFKYQDLFSRLLKVQKQRRHSEVKSPVIRLPSFDSANLKRNNSTRAKNSTSMAKRCDSGLKIKNTLKERNSSGKKMITRQPQTDRKMDIFKSFSPTQKNKKTIVHANPVKKRLEKKNSSQLKSTTKPILKPKNA